ncbi:hypothetical protein J8J14_15735 [Roseomonas sp. SSH11]|uniref:Uncharacterized protein n=1 Tax=Pararoseomonas baculiformis TaxID=2820812 RepID=A0ABS4AGU0_9PROT|nr:hypothetical protein [Pararoseomonas baculiformis]MBP0446225.1 hypothetical protein [Pararoseomonas baculiformis]
MSSFRTQAIAGRVVLVHDMPDQVVVSEFDAAEAATLIRQLEDSLAEVLRGLAQQASGPLRPEMVG